MLHPIFRQQRAEIVTLHCILCNLKNLQKVYPFSIRCSVNILPSACGFTGKFATNITQYINVVQISVQSALFTQHCLAFSEIDENGSSLLFQTVYVVPTVLRCHHLTHIGMFRDGSPIMVHHCRSVVIGLFPCPSAHVSSDTVP